MASNQQQSALKRNSVAGARIFQSYFCSDHSVVNRFKGSQVSFRSVFAHKMSSFNTRYDLSNQMFVNLSELKKLLNIDLF